AKMAETRSDKRGHFVLAAPTDWPIYCSCNINYCIGIDRRMTLLQVKWRSLETLGNRAVIATMPRKWAVRGNAMKKLVLVICAAWLASCNSGPNYSGDWHLRGSKSAKITATLGAHYIGCAEENYYYKMANGEEDPGEAL